MNNTWPSLHNSAFIGFDELFNKIKEMEKPTTGFPVYDIIKDSEEGNTTILALAVAGFTKDEIEVVLENDKLKVSGVKKPTSKQKIYLYKGIAERDFKRTFTIANTVEVDGVFLENGILTIHLRNHIPEQKTPKIFKIN